MTGVALPAEVGAVRCAGGPGRPQAAASGVPDDRPGTARASGDRGRGQQVGRPAASPARHRRGHDGRARRRPGHARPLTARPSMIAGDHLDPATFTAPARRCAATAVQRPGALPGDSAGPGAGRRAGRRHLLFRLRQRQAAGRIVQPLLVLCLGAVPTRRESGGLNGQTPHVFGWHPVRASRKRSPVPGTGALITGDREPSSALGTPICWGPLRRC